MIKKTIQFKDYNGVDRTKDLYFHVSTTSLLTASNNAYEEIVQIGQDLQERGKLLEKIDTTTTMNENDPFDENNKIFADSIRMVARLLDRLIDLSYGERSEDGMRFVRNDQVLNDFKQSIVYDAFVEQMLGDQDEMLNFITNLVSKK